MRFKLAVLTGLFLGSLAPGALAQGGPAPAPFSIPAADVASTYCLYGGLLYSIGAIVGTGEGGPPVAIRCGDNRQWSQIAAPPPPPGRR